MSAAGCRATSGSRRVRAGGSRTLHDQRSKAPCHAERPGGDLSGERAIAVVGQRRPDVGEGAWQIAPPVPQRAGRRTRPYARGRSWRAQPRARRESGAPRATRARSSCGAPPAGSADVRSSRRRRPRRRADLPSRRRRCPAPPSAVGQHLGAVEQVPRGADAYGHERPGLQPADAVVNPRSRTRPVDQPLLLA